MKNTNFLKQIFDIEDNAHSTYKPIVSSIVLRSMYNYCVSYVYGINKTKMFMI